MKFIKLASLIYLILISTHLAPDQPQPRHVESLVYPDFARVAQIQDSVIVNLTVNQEGEVASAAATSGHPELRKAAVANIKQWKFNPGSAENRHLLIEYVFRLEQPRRYYKPETRNIFDLPNRVEVILSTLI